MARGCGQAPGFLDGNTQTVTRVHGDSNELGDTSTRCSVVVLSELIERMAITAGSHLKTTGNTADGGDADRGALMDVALGDAFEQQRQQHRKRAERGQSVPVWVDNGGRRI